METKRARVIMLPRGVWFMDDMKKDKLEIKLSKGNLFKYVSDSGVGPCGGLTTKAIGGGFPVEYQVQHLYLVTDDEIKEGDWCIDLDFNRVFHASSSESQIREKELNSSKIVATTDSKLFVKTKVNERLDCTPNDWKDTSKLPQPSGSFIQKYCEVGGIDEVLLELDEDKRPYLCMHECRKRNYPCSKNNICLEDRVKITKNNRVIIHPIKTSWSREEVKQLLSKAFSSDLVNTQSAINLDDWINNNLK